MVKYQNNPVKLQKLKDFLLYVRLFDAHNYTHEFSGLVFSNHSLSTTFSENMDKLDKIKMRRYVLDSMRKGLEKASMSNINQPLKYVKNIHFDSRVLSLGRFLVNMPRVNNDSGQNLLDRQNFIDQVIIDSESQSDKVTLSDLPIDAVLNISEFLHDRDLSKFLPSYSKLFNARNVQTSLRKLLKMRPNLGSNFKGLSLTNSTLALAKKVLSAQSVVHVYRPGILGFVGMTQQIKASNLKKNQVVAGVSNVVWQERQQLKQNLSKPSNMPKYKEKFRNFTGLLNRAILMHPRIYNNFESLLSIALILILVGIAMEAKLSLIAIFSSPFLIICCGLMAYMLHDVNNRNLNASNFADSVNSSSFATSSDSFELVQQKIDLSSRLNQELDVVSAN